MNAAPAVLEPRANDEAAITGIIAPSASPKSVAGAKAATATERSLNSVSTVGDELTRSKADEEGQRPAQVKGTCRNRPRSGGGQ
jgi:hypothetical protein